jgi:hypothetical protein
MILNQVQDRVQDDKKGIPCRYGPIVIKKVIYAPYRMNSAIAAISLSFIVRMREKSRPVQIQL